MIGCLPECMHGTGKRQHGCCFSGVCEMAENCRVMQPCNVEFNLEEDAFCVLFGRLLVPFETLYKGTARFELDTETRQLKLTSSDWNSFTAAKKLIEQLLSATLGRALSRDYEDTVNQILTLAKVPKKHLLGKLRDVFIDCNNVAMALVPLVHLIMFVFVHFT